MSLALVDRFGHAMERAEEGYSLPSMRGAGGWAEGHGVLGASTGNIYGIDRHLERRASRVAFYLNPLVEGITGLLTSYVVGDEFSYGTLDDPRAQETLEDFWSLNNYDLLAERMWLEYLIDGESAAVFDTDARPDEPAHMALIDVDRPFELESNSLDGVTKLSLEVGGERRAYEQGEFTWTAHQALWNDPRGWPVMMRAIPSCLAYIGLINSRLRAQDLLGRINATYHQLYYPGSPNADAKFEAKTQKYSRVPKDGNVVGLAIDAKTGHREEFKFTESPRNASDAAEDGRLIRMLAAVALIIPPTWLGDAEDSNRASSAEMNGPPLTAMKRRQSTFRSMNNRNVRHELVRRHGPDHRYLVRYSEVSKNDPLTRKKKTKRVPASMIEVPWVMPQINDATLLEIVKKVELMGKDGLASKQTRQEHLGLDPATEQERMAREKPATQRIVTRTQPKPEPTAPQDDGSEQTEEDDDES